MIKHIVLLEFASAVDELKINRVLEKLGDLRFSEVPQIKHFSYGKNCSSEDLNHGFNYAFIMEFATVVDRNIYLDNATHKYIAKHDVLPLLANGGESVMVMDYLT